MLRVYFTADDIARVRLTGHRLPELVETVLSLQVLQRADQQSRFGDWRRGLRGRLPVSVTPALAMVPAAGWIPDFLTPYQAATDVLGGLRAVAATPADWLAADLARHPSWHRRSSRAARLAAGDQAVMSVLVTALAAYHEVAIAPYAGRMQTALDGDLAVKTSTLVRRGAGALLASLHPAIQWRPPVLEVAGPVDADVHLAGRGLVISPLMFCGPAPRLRVDPAGADPAVLAVPVGTDPVRGSPLALRADPVAGAPPGLVKVFGATRAAVLAAIMAAPGLTTSMLACRVDIALSSAVEHAGALRQACLVTSHRDGNRTRHYPTSTAHTLTRAQ